MVLPSFAGYIKLGRKGWHEGENGDSYCSECDSQLSWKVGGGERPGVAVTKIRASGVETGSHSLKRSGTRRQY